MALIGEELEVGPSLRITLHPVVTSPPGNSSAGVTFRRRRVFSPSRPQANPMQRLTSIIAEPVNVHEPNRARSEPSPDAVQFARFLEGDDGAFMQLFDRHTHRLYLYCLKFVGDR